jgi:protein-S-isoprenylcysteine O-methyltransferase Ste14
MKWKNVPIPETIVIPLALGSALDGFFIPPPIPPNLILNLMSAAALLAGLSLGAWSVRTAGQMDMTSPDELITQGPYSISRNPMYLAWILIYLSAIAFTRFFWSLLFFPVALIATHYWAVLPEENELHEEFGESFEDYRSQVGRYL